MSRFGLLMLGAGRGGTSLAAALLNAHPALDVEVEEFTYPYLLGHRLPGATGRERVTAFRAACDELASHRTARIWGNKVTSEQVATLRDAVDAPDPVGTFLAGMAGVPLLFVLRDGRACVASKVARTGQDWETAAERWLFSLELWRAAEERGGTTIRFEDLVRDPEPTLRTVCDVVGVAYDDAMLDGTTSERIRPEYRRDGLDASRAVPPEIPPAVLRLIAPGLEAAGYGG